VNTLETGDLAISKTVEGTTSGKAFTFTVTLTNGENVNGTHGDLVFADGVATIDLVGGQTAVATNLPAGIAYTVE